MKSKLLDYKPIFEMKERKKRKRTVQKIKIIQDAIDRNELKCCSNVNQYRVESNW